MSTGRTSGDPGRPRKAFAAELRWHWAALEDEPTQPRPPAPAQQRLGRGQAGNAPEPSCPCSSASPIVEAALGVRNERAPSCLACQHA